VISADIKNEQGGITIEHIIPKVYALDEVLVGQQGNGMQGSMQHLSCNRSQSNMQAHLIGVGQFLLFLLKLGERNDKHPNR
jgi:hypothetical protein